MSQSSTVEQAEDTALLLGAEALSIGDDGRPVLVGSHCLSCDTQMIPPAPICPACGSEEIERRDQPRDGRLYSYSVLHVGSARWRRPLALGYVDLDNGARVFTHLEGNDLAIGDTVEVGVGTVGDDEEGPITSFVFRKVKR